MTKIYCQERNGMHEFYMTLDKSDYYLFSQKFRVGVDNFYKKGVLLDKGIKDRKNRLRYTQNYGQSKKTYSLYRAGI